MNPDIRHKHLIVRAEVRRAFLANECHIVEQWLTDLVKAINMKILFGPKALYHDIPGNRGMTAFAIIETSHLVFHAWDECEPSILQLDVYSCSEFDIKTVFQMLEIFRPLKTEYKFIDREHSLIEIEQSSGF